MNSARADWEVGKAPDESEPWDNIPEAARDPELPGMWELADFTGGLDEVRA